MLSHEQVLTLRLVKAKEGRTWKSKLSSMWQKASYPGYSDHQASVLQALRNSASFGPRGLLKAKV